MERLSLSSRLLAFTACTLLLMVGVHPSYAVKTHRAPKQIRQQIDDLEEQWKTATLNGDATLMDRLLSDDYVGISWSGQVNTKATQLERIRSRTLVITRIDFSDVKVKLLGPVAIVTCTSDIEGTNDGSSITGTFRYTRVYQRISSNVWKITNFEATRVPNSRHDRASSSGPQPSERSRQP